MRIARNLDGAARGAIAFALVALIAGCATPPGGSLIPAPLEVPRSETSLGPAGQVGERPQPATSVEATPSVPSIREEAREKAVAHAPERPEKASIRVSLEQVPLPSFIQTVFGKILGKNLTIDPAIASRTDLVTLRTSKPQTPAEVESTARMVLESYGVAVVETGGLYRFVASNNVGAFLPEIRMGRALPEVPLPLRPVFWYYELKAVSPNDMLVWLTNIFGSRVKVLADPKRPGILIGGNSDDVAAAVQAVDTLDQPAMRGRHSIRINPVFWSADDLAKKLESLLQGEGYDLGVGNAPGGANAPITLVPIPEINALIAFASDSKVLEHLVSWAQDLDKPSAGNTSGNGYFTYQARYTDAGELAKTLKELLAGAPLPAAAAPAPGAARPASPSAAIGRAPKIVVNSATNTLIFEGNIDGYRQILNLLKDLDQPSKSALIEVTVAEVDLTAADQLGIEWGFQFPGAHGSTITGGTVGGLGLGTAGLTIRGLNAAGDTRLVLNALASENHARILSSPRVLARNGDTATIQVGSQVPVLTSQQTTPVTGGTGSIIQTVQYVPTGVILKVKPIIHAGDRIDLDVSQEVSAAQATNTGVSGSPTISTRKVDTRLSVRDGTTVLLGGLISDNVTNNVTGVPLLKDIPVVGQLFRNNVNNDNRQELIVLITPYIVGNDRDAQAITNAFRKQLGSWAQSPELGAPEAGSRQPQKPQ